MATATRNARAAKQVVRSAGAVSKSTSMEFVTFDDNGGSYHWMLVAGNGETLAQSKGFTSYEDAQQAARDVRDGAASATFKARAGHVGRTGARQPCRGRKWDRVLLVFSCRCTGPVTVTCQGDGSNRNVAPERARERV